MAVSTSDITRRMRDGILSETIHAWHYESQGPGERGGRTYHVLYGPTGLARIDVSDACSSTLRTVWVSAKEIRPRVEWLEHLAAKGIAPVEPRYCTADGLEIDQDSDPELDEGFCSAECRSESRADW